MRQVRFQAARVAAVLIAGLLQGCAHGQAAPSAAVCAEFADVTRHELYFGLQRPEGQPVTEEEWGSFLDAEVASRFPTGLTVLDATGQYRNQQGQLISEKSRVVILLYPDTPEHRQHIREIIVAYETTFSQESVGWARVPAKTCFS